jgi:hypothetical protein
MCTSFIINILTYGKAKPPSNVMLKASVGKLTQSSFLINNMEKMKLAIAYGCVF